MNIDDLLVFLFFQARAHRHSDYDGPPSIEELGAVAEVVRRMGPEWIERRIDRWETA